MMVMQAMKSLKNVKIASKYSRVRISLLNGVSDYISVEAIS
jgi:hypothetical protein